MSDLLFIRTDGGARIGSGHVMRCLALAQGWQRAGGRAVFAQAESTPSLENRIGANGMDVLRLDVTPGSSQDAAQTAELAQESGAAWVVADGYGFGADWQRAIKDSGLRLLFWDDYGHAEYYSADLILNQNLHAAAGMYSQREPYTQLLMGPRYAQLRSEFLDWRDWKREIPAVARKVLVTLGGSDPDNVTGKVVRALAPLHGMEVLVVAGGNNPNIEALRSAVAPLSSFVRLAVDVPNMPELMAWADVAVSAGGSTLWELAFMGLPSLVIVLAYNQADSAAALDRERISVTLGNYRDVDADRVAAALKALLVDSALREQMSRCQRKLVDGRGAQSVIMRMLAIPIRLRRAVAEDCKSIWESANDPEVRAASFSSGRISWETHVEWYSAKMRDPHCFWYIAADEIGNTLGQIRFQMTGLEGTISVSLVPAARGRGYGPAIILRGAEQFFAASNVHTVHAYIKMDNHASVTAFERADFTDAGTAEVAGHRTRHFVFHKRALT